MKIHIGTTKNKCMQLKVHGFEMPEVFEVTYLGDILAMREEILKMLKVGLEKDSAVSVLALIILKLHCFCANPSL